MTEEDIHDAASLLSEESKNHLARNYCKWKINPDPSKYYLSGIGVRMIECLIAQKDPAVLQALDSMDYQP